MIDRNVQSQIRKVFKMGAKIFTFLKRDQTTRTMICARVSND